VFGLCQVKQVGGLEHGGRLGEMVAAANLYFMEPKAFSKLL
jgi:hypothetical protein